MENIMLLILGLFIVAIGCVNIKGNISTIHSYNRRKVKEEDIPKYGKNRRNRHSHYRGFFDCFFLCYDILE